MSFNESPGGIGVTYTPWLRKLQLNDVYLATMAGYFKLNEMEAIAGSLSISAWVISSLPTTLAMTSVFSGPGNFHLMRATRANCPTKWAWA